jgi:hypothetical protein
MIVLPDKNDVPIAQPRGVIVLAALFVPPSDAKTVTVYPLPELVAGAVPGTTALPLLPGEQPLAINNAMMDGRIRSLTFTSRVGVSKERSSPVRDRRPRSDGPEHKWIELCSRSFERGRRECVAMLDSG